MSDSIRSLPPSTASRIVLKICLALQDASEEAKAAKSFRVAHILQSFVVEATEILGRHFSNDDQEDFPYIYCVGCGYDIDGGHKERWPCPEVISIAKAVGVEL